MPSSLIDVLVRHREDVVLPCPPAELSELRTLADGSSSSTASVLDEADAALDRAALFLTQHIRTPDATAGTGTPPPRP